MYKTNPLLQEFSIDPLTAITTVTSIYTASKISKKVNKLLTKRNKNHLINEMINNKSLFDRICNTEIQAHTKLLNQVIENKNQYLLNNKLDIQQYEEEVYQLKLEISYLTKIHNTYDCESLVEFLKINSKSIKTISIIIGILIAAGLAIGKSILFHKMLDRR